MPKKTKRSKKEKISKFFENVKSRRLELKLNQGDVAERMGIAQSRISVLENGTFVETPERLEALCRALETDPNHLFGFASEE